MSHNQINLLIDDGVIVDCDRHNVNASSLDIRLGKKLLIERSDYRKFQEGKLRRISLKQREQLTTIEWDLEREGPFILSPGEFILAHSIEMFNLPNNVSAEYKLKSSMARIGLEHLNAGWCDAGWHGSVLTLELCNMTRCHEIVLEYQDSIGQMVFFLHEEVPQSASYSSRGRYNNDRSVSGAKTKHHMIAYGDKVDDNYQEEFDKNNPNMEVVLNPPRRVIEVDENETGNS
jgi:dCTP deaminase